MKYLLILVLLTINTTQANFDDNFGDPLVQIRELSITGKKFTETPRWPLITDLSPPSQLNYGLDLKLDTNFLFYFYFNNTISSMVDQTQFRSVSYKFEVGARILPCLYIEYGHNSWHVFDTIYRPGFPVYDYIGFKINIVNPSKDKTIFWYFDKGSE